MEDTKLAAEYLRNLLHGSTGVAPKEWKKGKDALNQMKALRWAAKILKKARENVVVVPWRLEDLLSRLGPGETGQTAANEARFSEEFPPLPSRHIEEPAVVVDLDNNVLLWFLPNLLMDDYYNVHYRSLVELALPLKVEANGGWRGGPEYYRSADSDSESTFADSEFTFPPGTINLAPVNIMQGRTVSTATLHISTSLTFDDTETDKWLARTRVPTAVVGAVLSAVHPAQFDAAIRNFDVAASNDIMKNTDRLANILPNWTAPFHGMSIISNRETPAHRDSNGIREGMDCILGLGDRDDGVFRSSTLGLTFAYRPGTGFFFNALGLRHEAEVPGNRACIAYYSKKKIHQKFGGGDIGLPKLPDW